MSSVEPEGRKGQQGMGASEGKISFGTKIKEFNAKTIVDTVKTTRVPTTFAVGSFVIDMERKERSQNMWTYIIQYRARAQGGMCVKCGHHCGTCTTQE